MDLPAVPRRGRGDVGAAGDDQRTTGHEAAAGDDHVAALAVLLGWARERTQLGGRTIGELPRLGMGLGREVAGLVARSAGVHALRQAQDALDERALIDDAVARQVVRVCRGAVGGGGRLTLARGGGARALVRREARVVGVAVPLPLPVLVSFDGSRMGRSEQPWTAAAPAICKNNVRMRSMPQRGPGGAITRHGAPRSAANCRRHRRPSGSSSDISPGSPASTIGRGGHHPFADGGAAPER